MLLRLSPPHLAAKMAGEVAGEEGREHAGQEQAGREHLELLVVVGAARGGGGGRGGGEEGALARTRGRGGKHAKLLAALSQVGVSRGWLVHATRSLHCPLFSRCSLPGALHPSLHPPPPPPPPPPTHPHTHTAQPTNMDQ